jgi:hypothetical protein
VDNRGVDPLRQAGARCVATDGDNEAPLEELVAVAAALHAHAEDAPAPERHTTAMPESLWAKQARLEGFC